MTEHWCVLCAWDGLYVPPVVHRRPVKPRKAHAARPVLLEPTAPEPESLLVVSSAPPRPAPRSRQARERRRQREESAPGTATAVQLAARWAYYGGRCWMCGRPATLFEHVKPLFRGGCNWPSNQRPSCWPCNGLKGIQWPFVRPARQFSESSAADQCLEPVKPETSFGELAQL